MPTSPDTPPEYSQEYLGAYPEETLSPVTPLGTESSLGTASSLGGALSEDVHAPSPAVSQNATAQPVSPFTEAEDLSPPARPESERRLVEEDLSASPLSKPPLISKRESQPAAGRPADRPLSTRRSDTVVKRNSPASPASLAYPGVQADPQKASKNHPHLNTLSTFLPECTRLFVIPVFLRSRPKSPYRSPGCPRALRSKWLKWWQVGG